MSAPGSWDEFDWEAHWGGIVKGTFQPPAQPITWSSLYKTYADTHNLEGKWDAPETQTRIQAMGPVEFRVCMANLLDRLPLRKY